MPSLYTGKLQFCHEDVIIAPLYRDVITAVGGVIHLSNSALSSDSVGSIMSVPGTGHDMVGLWNP